MVMQVRRQDVKTEHSKHSGLKRPRALISVPVVVFLCQHGFDDPMQGSIIFSVLRMAPAKACGLST
jgi:hypothetical protein